MAKEGLIKIGAFWERETFKGDKYLSGSRIDNGQLVMFKNGFKKADNHPDWILYISEVRKKDEQSGDAERTSGEDVFENPRVDEDDELVPF